MGAERFSYGVSVPCGCCAARAFFLYGAKVWKTLMSIERRRNQEKRSVRTFIALASEAGWPRWTGWGRDCGGQAPALRWPGRRASLTVGRGPVPRNDAHEGQTMQETQTTDQRELSLSEETHFSLDFFQGWV